MTVNQRRNRKQAKPHTLCLSKKPLVKKAHWFCHKKHLAILVKENGTALEKNHLERSSHPSPAPKQNSI